MSVHVVTTAGTVVVAETSAGHLVDVTTGGITSLVEINNGIPIPTGVVNDLVLGEIPAGDIDGVNNEFETAFDFSSVSLYINGLKQLSAHYSTSGNNVIIIDDPPRTGDEVTVDYLKL